MKKPSRFYLIDNIVNFRRNFKMHGVVNFEYYKEELICSSLLSSVIHIDAPMLLQRLMSIKYEFLISHRKLLHKSGTCGPQWRTFQSMLNLFYRAYKFLNEFQIYSFLFPIFIVLFGTCITVYFHEIATRKVMS